MPPRSGVMGRCAYGTILLGAYRTNHRGSNYRTTDLGMWTLWDQEQHLRSIPLSDDQGAECPNYATIIGQQRKKDFLVIGLDFRASVCYNVVNVETNYYWTEDHDAEGYGTNRSGCVIGRRHQVCAIEKADGPILVRPNGQKKLSGGSCWSVS